MQKSYRQALFFVSLVGFLVLAPLLVLYAVGYRPVAGVDPVPVGVLLLETKPRGAQVFVDGEYYGRTPEAVSGLDSTEVSVSLQLDGYNSWEKKLPVVPGRSTETRDIILFPEKKIVETIDTDISQFSVSPSRKLVAIQKPSGLIKVIDSFGENITTGKFLSFAAAGMLWSPDNDSLILSEGDKRYWLAPVVEGQSPRLLSALNNATDVVWDPRIPNRILFLSPNLAVKALNTENLQLTTIATSITTFATSDRYIYALHTDGRISQTTLSGSFVTDDVPMPEGVLTGLFVTPSNKFAYQLDDGSVWVRTQNKEFKKLIEQAEKVAWSPDARLIMLQTDPQTIHVYNYDAERATISEEETALVLRLSRNIVDPQWFSGSRHIMYQVDDEIHITEIDHRDHPVDYLADTTNNGNANAAVGEGGELIYYLKNQGAKTDLAVVRLVLEDS